MTALLWALEQLARAARETARATDNQHVYGDLDEACWHLRHARVEHLRSRS